MGIDVSPMTVAWLCFIYATSTMAFIIGSEIQRRRNKEELREAYLEADELRYTIQDLIASGRSLSNHASLKKVK
jgi:hypothetical protein